MALSREADEAALPSSGAATGGVATIAALAVRRAEVERANAAGGCNAAKQINMKRQRRASDMLCVLNVEK